MICPGIASRLVYIRKDESGGDLMQGSNDSAPLTAEQRAAAELLYRRYHAAMKRRALAYVSSPEDAEDVVAACWLSLLRNMPRLQALPEGAQTNYILCAVRNRAIDCLRRRRGDVSLSEVGEVPDGSDPLQAVADQDALEGLLRPLPQQQRRIVELKLDGCPSREIAAQLCLSADNIRAGWRRALRRMRASLTGGERR